jgi:pimeloyl-ACP methyl ester carboxylesterase
MTNSHYTDKQRQFWEFSFDEMAKYDLPAQIDYVLRMTGVKKLTYMGHSEGTTVAFAAFSTNFTLVSLINQYIALAPIAYLGNCQSLLFNEMARYDGDKLLLALGGQGEFMFPKVVMKLIPNLCRVDPQFCDKATDAMWGPSTEINNTRLPYIYTYEPSPTSNKNAAHWAQSIRSMQFQMYDYGPVDNEKIYGTVLPPKYPLNKIPADLKIALFTGGNDYLADPTDVAILVKDLVTPPYVHFEPNYAHCDYIWAENAPQLIYPDILRLVMAA